MGGKTPISKAYQEVQKLADDLVIKLAKLGAHIEDHYGHPQDIEWAYENNKLLIVQSRPVTTLNPNQKKLETHLDKKLAVGSTLILEGLAASPGVASGPVKIVNKVSQISQVKDGDILVAEMTNPDFVPAMRKASAILTDQGGRTSHAAIVSRELGIPAVVGSLNATQLLSNGEMITVDGSNGKVYEGDLVVEEEVKETITSLGPSELKTATKVYMNLAEPFLADHMASLKVDGVGLLRAEFMIAEIGIHPRKFIEDGKGHEFTQSLAKGLETFARAFSPRPVVYRATDFRTNEYRNLKGGSKYEQEEFNPMIGFRGVSRYLEDAEVFKLEIEAIKKVRNKLGYKNLWLMLPFVRTVDQLKEVKKLVLSYGLRRSPTFKLWMMVEVPSNVILLDEFIDVGIDGLSIGTNDLTMLTLGVDRDNPRVADVYSELDESVMKSLEKIVTTASKRDISCSICGQAPSEYPEMVEKLVEWGITSVSVSPDVLEKTRKIVYDAEHAVVKAGHKKASDKAKKGKDTGLKKKSSSSSLKSKNSSATKRSKAGRKKSTKKSTSTKEKAKSTKSSTSTKKKSSKLKSSKK